MDLRSVLNTSDNGERKRAQSSPTGPPQPQPPKQHPAHPQAQYAYVDYPPHGSPGKHPGHPPHQHPQYQGGNYPPQSPYKQPPPQQQHQHQRQPPSHQHQHQHQHQQQQQQQQQHPATYASRPGPPTSYHDPRSPTGPAPAPSPYRGPPAQTRESSGPYPFPPAQQHQPQPQELQSPTQRHQYPPGHYPQQRRDSHGQSTAPPPHPTTPYVKQQHQVPQTPPIATSGNPQHPYPHQQSHSAHSTPTPTSAHSAHQFGPPQHGSPVGPPPGQAEYNRHPSQPATPLGPPQQISSRHSSYHQPASPYQSNKRPPSRDTSISQPSAPEPSRGQTPVRPTPPSRGGQEVTMQDAPSHARILLDREPSMSVSPKTRVGSLPSNADRSDNESKPARKSQSNADSERDRAQRASTPAKRKLDDRSISPGELEHKHQRPPPGETNGRHESPTQTRRKSSHGPPRKNRKPHAQPPVWALDASTLGKKMPTHANFVLHERHAPANGHSGSISHVKTEPDSQNGSPEVQKPQRGQSVTATTATAAATATTTAPPPEPGPADILGAWEATITGVKPYEEVSKAVADFLFVNVVNGSDIQEIMSRGIKFEIEAKLGTLIDKDTNHRVDRNVASECILENSARVAFRSSMTEVHHKAFNDFLNHVVIQADPRAPHGGNRVQVHYKHRRELDRFFELPPEMQNRIPGCMRARLGGRGRSVKVRVTHDQKTQEVIGKIIKARVADIDIHMPTSPMDCRISINLEMDWDGSLDELEQLASQGDKQPDRAKDRLSYTQGHYQVDLTQVTQTFSGPGNAARTEKEHELEIELAPEILIDQGRKAMSGGVHRYQELVEGFVDNVRVLARKARDFQ